MKPASVFPCSSPRTMFLSRDYFFLLILAAQLWAVHAVWLMRDTRPPVWDMAMHQSYAMNYLPGAQVSPARHYWDLSGNYPPFVHLVIACAYALFHPGPRIAVLANIPACLLLLWGVYELGKHFAGSGAARWACALVVLTPYMIWMSRETILDYWLSAWVAAGLALLVRSRDFESRPASLWFGCACGLGLLTKWIFVGFLAAPVAAACLRSRIWRSRENLVNLADSALIALGMAGFWYVPALPKLIPYFIENARIGALEGEPAIFSFQSLIYYLRLLEGYQLFGLLFLLLLFSIPFVWKKRLFGDSAFWCITVAGGWLAMSLLRTKDPRFTMPLLGLLAIAPGAWIHSWGDTWKSRLLQACLLCLLGIQAFAINFGIGWLPEEVVLLKGYQGSLRWDWNLYMQNYFRILGPPRQEDWKQEAILRRVAEHAAQGKRPPALAIVPDLARFSAANFHLVSRLLRLNVVVDHPQIALNGVRSFDGFDYVVMTEKEQGMPWSTKSSVALNQIIVDEHEVFILLDIYKLPNGDAARLYYIRRGERQGG